MSVERDFPDHFSGVSEDYATFRPVYPDALFHWLSGNAPDHGLAVDLATGTGQAALALADRFRRVIALDASREQIKRARPHERVEYRVAAAEATGLEGADADLVTVAQALHWFDLERFFDHADSILCPGGLLAAWTYELLYFGDPAIDGVIDRFYRERLGPYWPPQRALVETGYRDLRWPYPELVSPDFEISATLDPDALAGYLGTWSAVSRYREATATDPIPELHRALLAAWGDGPRAARWPLALRVGRKPGHSDSESP